MPRVRHDTTAYAPPGLLDSPTRDAADNIRELHRLARMPAGEFCAEVRMPMYVANTVTALGAALNDARAAGVDATRVNRIHRQGSDALEAVVRRAMHCGRK